MMVVIRAGRFVSVCVPTAAVMAALALVAPGAASASLGEQCSGSNITGQGASVLKLAEQTVWDEDFHTTAAKRACNGTQGSKGTPTVTYNSTSSGAGLESWGVNGHAADFEASNAWVSTDEPPNSEQISEIEAHGKTELSFPGTVLTIPVLQGAVAVIVNLPSGCEGVSKANAHRIVLNNVTLEEIFRGVITKWSEITDSEDKLLAEKGKTCNPETTITPVVRPDEAGTTHIFKKYLDLINKGAFETEKAESKTWTEISEGTENTTWPKAANVIRPTKTGDSAEIAKVEETPSSIGYGSLVNTRSNKSFAPPAGGPYTSSFWVELQNNGIGTAGTITYAEPSTNGDAVAAANSNCADTEYTNGEEVPFPPSSVVEPWNEVTTNTIEKNYPLCGLSYALSLHSYSKYPGTTLQEATTAENFLYYVLGTGPLGGQSLINNHDYLALPTGPVLTEATAGVEKIRY
jgi:ABC-type phosphate transport system substrate-binding protein